MSEALKPQLTPEEQYTQHKEDAGRIKVAKDNLKAVRRFSDGAKVYGEELMKAAAERKQNLEKTREEWGVDPSSGIATNVALLNQAIAENAAMVEKSAAGEKITVNPQETVLSGNTDAEKQPFPESAATLVEQAPNPEVVKPNSEPPIEIPNAPTPPDAPKAAEAPAAVALEVPAAPEKPELKINLDLNLEKLAREKEKIRDELVVLCKEIVGAGVDVGRDKFKEFGLDEANLRNSIQTHLDAIAKNDPPKLVEYMNIIKANRDLPARIEEKEDKLAELEREFGSKEGVAGVIESLKAEKVEAEKLAAQDEKAEKSTRSVTIRGFFGGIFHGLIKAIGEGRPFKKNFRSGLEEYRSKKSAISGSVRLASRHEMPNYDRDLKKLESGLLELNAAAALKKRYGENFRRIREGFIAGFEPLKNIISPVKIKVQENFRKMLKEEGIDDTQRAAEYLNYLRRQESGVNFLDGIELSFKKYPTLEPNSEEKRVVGAVELPEYVEMLLMASINQELENELEDIYQKAPAKDASNQMQNAIKSFAERLDKIKPTRAWKDNRSLLINLLKRQIRDTENDLAKRVFLKQAVLRLGLAREKVKA